MTDISQAAVRRLACMVAGRALDDVLNVADLSERFPDPDLREAVTDEVQKIASRLKSRGSHPAEETIR
ncbi:hypothetical protein [Streptomyces sp. MK37H]|uniref:hypothetical protein n=1 Tax=Streptomyces sp. MK37H TaxID=2699117 RepID=UPI001B37D0CA|nr:hypothetical protein [Streptomyces sp. MK37H]MBP8538579.1 hypothetical protein [Streptomyces sp. MK37H]